MDVSEIYVKMCDKSGLEECCSYGIPAFTGKVKYIGDNVFVELDQCSTTWRTVRLLRQSQIQEMMGNYEENIKNLYWLLESGWHEEADDELGIKQKFMSFEQLWLGFYILENHQKIWDSEKEQWVKSE